MHNPRFQYLLMEQEGQYYRRVGNPRNVISICSLTAMISWHPVAVSFYAAMIFMIDSLLAANASAAKISSSFREG